MTKLNLSQLTISILTAVALMGVTSIAAAGGEGNEEALPLSSVTVEFPPAQSQCIADALKNCGAKEAPQPERPRLAPTKSVVKAKAKAKAKATATATATATAAPAKNGERGVAGAKGDRGDRGADGAKGERGLRGLQGPSSPSTFTVGARGGVLALHSSDDTNYLGALLAAELTFRVSNAFRLVLDAGVPLSAGESPAGSFERLALGVSLTQPLDLEVGVSTTWFGYDSQLNASQVFMMGDVGLRADITSWLDVAGSVMVGREHDLGATELAVGGFGLLTVHTN